MTTSTTAAPATHDRSLVVTLLSLQSSLMKAELQDAMTSAAVAAVPANAKEMADDFAAMAKEVNSKLDDLMVARLAEGEWDVPVLRTVDVDRVLEALLKGASMNRETFALMETLRPIVQMGIAGRLSTLAAIHSNTHEAFWQFGQAIVNTAVSHHSTPTRVMKEQAGRITVYRQIMTPETWRALNRERVAQFAGVTHSVLLGAAAKLQSDEAAIALEKGLAEADTATNSERTAYAKRIGSYYTTLGRKIWPATKQA